VPVVTVVRGPGEERPAPVVERALSGPAGPRGRSWRERVTLVPGGGQGPGKARPGEQQEERDKARARLPLPGPRRIVVLGCTSGAGQTVTALMTARLLASLRAEPVAVLDLNPGPGSLTSRARCAPAGTVRDLLAGSLPAAPGSAAPAGPAATGPAAASAHPAGRLEVINTGAAPDSAKALEEGDFGRIGEYLAGRYGISLVDPGASAVGRVLAIADQLLLVAPASGDAPRAVSMTQEWLAQHDHAGLAEGAVMVVNGVSGRSMADVEKAEAIMQGRCRAIVRVPWEDQLGGDGGPCAGAGALRLPARQALTAVAGLLVSGLAAVPGAAGPGAAPAAGPGDQK
jgi:MinD-like ATPase involved in chromosome partitioning or flagellar assembly